MNTKKTIFSKSTDRLLSILPKHFKLTSDHNSNGYKFINTLYGVEVDNAIDILKDLYNNSFLSSLDMTQGFSIYEVRLSGVTDLNYVIADDIPVQIVNEYEFYNSPPTRLIPDNSGEYILLYSGIPPSFGLTGLEYFRSKFDGSGYLIISSNSNHEDCYKSGVYSAWVVGIDRVGNISDNWSGFYSGISDQNYEESGFDEVIYPESESFLQSKYPLYRTVEDESGNFHQIDHYEPYNGFVVNSSGNVIANNNYLMDYYFDDNNEKIYYRSALNNPNGSGNYNSVYISLRYPPISGSLKLYDLDILDSSGNATEIPSSGKMLYSLTSNYMFVGEQTGIFDPVYVGYDSTVPFNRGFGNIEGSTANPLKITSWNYMLAGSKLNDESLIWNDGSGEITNLIKITNPNSRYIVEYKYLKYKNTKYISSLNSNGLVSLDSDPVYSIDNNESNINPVDYEFSKDPRIVNDPTRIITFDGLNIRPYSKLHRIDINLPLSIDNQFDKFPSINLNKRYIGYSDKFIPILKTNKQYLQEYRFNDLSKTTVIDNSLNGNNLTYSSSVSNYIYHINYDTNFGKRLKYILGYQYFGIDSVMNFTTNSFYHFKFKSNFRNQITFLNSKNYNTNNYFIVTLDSSGKMIISSNGYTFYSDSFFNFNGDYTEIIVHYIADDVSSSVPEFLLYVKDNFYFRPLSMYRSTESRLDITGMYYTRFYENSNIDIGYAAIYTEAY